MGKVIYIESNGCLCRALDAQCFYNYFKINNFKITKIPKKADYILFIACANLKRNEEEAKKRIKELKRCRGELIVGGCIGGMSREWCNENISGKLFTSSNINEIGEFFPEFKVGFDEIPDANKGYPRIFFRDFKDYFINISQWRISFIGRLKYYFDYRIRRNYYIRIGTGCISEHCSYCTIWKATGPYKSKPIGICLNEFRDALSKGYKRIHFLADNLGPYGIDTGETLPKLLNEVIKNSGSYEIHLEELNPAWIIKYLNELKTIVESKRIKSIFCPIQSGSSRVLELMNRRYSADQLRHALLMLKCAYPLIKYYTDIIVGFPTETEYDFMDSLNLIKEIGFSSVSYYPYDEKEGTAAALLSPTVSAVVIKARVAKLESFLKQNGIGGGMF